MEEIVIIGNVGADPEMRYLESGTALTEFRVACNSVKSGEQVTRWYSVTTWGRLAETCNEYVHKGMEVGVAGEFSVDDWTGRDGDARYTLKINANRVKFMRDNRREEEDDGYGYGYGGE